MKLFSRKVKRNLDYFEREKKIYLSVRKRSMGVALDGGGGGTFKEARIKRERERTKKEKGKKKRRKGRRKKVDSIESEGRGEEKSR